MAQGLTRNLFIQIGGGVSNDLITSTKAGKSALIELGDAADGVQATVRSAFEKLGGNVADQAKAMEQAYARTFANIRATAQTALNAPSGAQGLVINLAAAKQEADQAQQSAVYLRTLADAQARLVETGQEASAGAKSLAVSLELQAISAEKGALAATETVAGLQRLAAASGIAVNDLDEVAGAHARIGAAGMIAEHVVRSFSDSIAAGQSPVRAFALEVPRVAEALQFFAVETGATTGALGKFAAFMGGPLGLALTLATSLLSPLVANLIEGGDASDHMKDQILSLTDALSAEKFGTEAATKALQDYNREKEKARENDSLASQRNIDEARRDIATATRSRDQYLSQATQLENAPAPLDESGQATRSATIAELRAKAGAQNDLIAQTQQNIREQQIDQAKEAAKAAGDPIEAIRQKYKQLSDAAEEAAAKSDKLAANLKGVLSNYALAEAAEVKAAEAKRRDEEQSERDGRQSGRQINLSEAEDIVRSIGGTVTSGYRSTAQQQVLYDRFKAGQGPLAAVPGTSEHERGQAVDIAKTAGVTLAKIVEAFSARGVHLTEKLDEGDHYHVAFGPKGPSADTLARRQRAQTDKVANTDRTYTSEVSQAQEAYSRAVLGITSTASQRYTIEVQSLQDRLTARKAEIDDMVIAGKIPGQTKQEVDANAEILRSLATKAAQLEEEKARRDLLISALDKQVAAEQQDARNRGTLIDLKSRTDIGRTAQRQDQLDRLSADEDAQRAPLRNILNHPQFYSQDQTDQARRDWDQIDAEHPLKVAAINQDTESPLDRYQRELKGSVGDIGDDLQNVQTDAIKDLGDDLDQAATKGLKLHGILGQITADIIKMAIEREIELPIVNALTSASGGSGAGGIFSVLGRLFGGGKAVGGAVSDSQFYLVGEQGPELFAPGKSGTIIPNHNLPTMPTLSSADVRAMHRPQSSVVLHVQANDYFDAKVASISGGQVQQAAPSIAAGGAHLATKTAARARRRSLVAQ